MSDENEAVSFELTLERKNVELVSHGQKRKCYLLEIDGYARDKYLTRERGRLGTGQSVKSFDDVQATLIQLMLHDAETDEKFELREIRSFPSKVQTGLYNLCNELCGFDQLGENKAETEAKNS
jgi:hypothetical protein